MECLNCQQEADGNYCKNCGQRTSTKRITMASLFENILMGISNINRGFLFNLKVLSLRPGKTIQAYLDGKRTKLFNPVQYAMISVAILTFISLEYGTNIAMGEGNSRPLEKSAAFSFGYEYGSFLKHNIKYAWLLTILFFSLPASLIFSKLNLAEHLTTQAFIGGHAAMVTVLLFPIFSTQIPFNPILYISIFILMIFTYRRYGSIGEVIGFSFIILFLGLLLFILIPAIIIWLIGQF